MNSDAPATSDPAAASPPPAPAKSNLPVVIGFVLGAVSWLTVCIPQPNYGQVLPLIFNCFALPVIAIILAVIPKTRRVGLGLLLAASLGWLVLGAICGASRR